MKKYNFTKKMTLKEVNPKLYEIFEEIKFFLKIIPFAAVYIGSSLGIAAILCQFLPHLFEVLWWAFPVAIVIIFIVLSIFVGVVTILHSMRMRNLPATANEMKDAGINTPEDFVQMLYWHAGKTITNEFAPKQAIKMFFCFYDLVKDNWGFSDEYAALFLQKHADYFDRWHLREIREFCQWRAEYGVEYKKEDIQYGIAFVFENSGEKIRKSIFF